MKTEANTSISESFSVGSAYKLGIILYSLLLLISSAAFSQESYDGFWLLKTAQDLFEKGWSPWVDHYSFTFPEESISSPRVIFGTIYYGFTQALGENHGVYALRLTAFTLTLGAMVVWLKRLEAPTFFWFLLLPMLIAALQYRPLIRPEIFSYFLIVVAFILYRNARNAPGWRTVIPVALLMLFWSNYHSSIFGWVVFFGLFVDVGYQLIRQRAPSKDWLNWLLQGIMVVGAGFFNPELQHPILGVLSFSAEWKGLIKEYGPPVDYFSFISFYVFSIAAIAALLLSIQQRRIGYLLVLLIFIQSASTMSRMLTPAVVVSTAILGELLSDAHRNQNHPKIKAAFLWGVGFFMILASTYQATRWAYLYATTDLSTRTSFPNQIVDSMKEAKGTGRIFNEYHLGGYLLYHLSPSYKVFIDGRTSMLYPLGFSSDFFNHKNNPAYLEDVFNSFKVDHAVLKNELKNVQNMYALGFELDVSDSNYSLFKAKSGKLMETGFAWASPYCWAGLSSASLLEEYDKLRSAQSSQGHVNDLSEAIAGLLNAKSKPEFLNRFLLTRETSDPVLRFIGYRALEERLLHQVIAAFTHLKSWELKDSLVLSYAYYLNGMHTEALNEQTKAIRNFPRSVTLNELIFQKVLLDLLSTKIEMTEIHKRHLVRASQTLADQPRDIIPSEPDPKIFCSS